jgi:ribose 5-phosphate isomerase B
MKIAIASDHAGVGYKTQLVNYLKTKGVEVKDFGPMSEESVDYPDYAHPVATAVEKKDADLGILLCGSGAGINMSANKHQAVRSALCWNSHIAEQARLHNNANILTMPARYLNWKEVTNIVDTFLDTKFEGGRHERRINKISI